MSNECLNDFLFHKIKEKQKNVRFKVSGSSMDPIIKDGDYIYVEPYKSQKLQVGNIIVFRKSFDHWTVHRIVDIYFSHELKTIIYKTKGDNNKMPDDYDVIDNEIIGIVREE